MGVFDDILAGVEESDRAVFEKYPTIKERLSKADQMEQYAKDWQTWESNNWDKAAKATKSELLAREEAKAAKARAAALELAEGTEMTFDEVLNNLKSSGYVDQQVAAAVNPLKSILLDEQGNPQISTVKDLNQLGAGFEKIYLSTVDLPLQHKEEFNERLNMEQLFKYVNENKLWADPRGAYDKMVATKREEIRKQQDAEREKKHQEAIEAARKEGEQKARTEQAMGGGAAGIPTDNGVSAGATSYMARKIAAAKGEKNADPAPGIELGDGLAAIGYEAYLKDKMSGATQ